MSEPEEVDLRDEIDASADEPAEGESAPRRRETLFIAIGAVLAVLIGVGMLAIPGPSEEEPGAEDEPETEAVVQKPPTAEPLRETARDRSAMPQEALSYLERSKLAEQEGNLQLAEAQLEEGLTLVPLSDARARQQFFHRLASLAARRGRAEAASLFEKTGERLGEKEEQARLLLEEGFAALAARDLPTARRRLCAFLLRTGDFSDPAAAARCEALAWRTLARAWFEDWRQLEGERGTNLPEPRFTFEGKQ